MNQFS